jgi:protein-L-isoaspartate(D-aspartate) O-methyltransferase
MTSSSRSRRQPVLAALWLVGAGTALVAPGPAQEPVASRLLRFAPLAPGAPAPTVSPREQQGPEAADEFAVARDEMVRAQIAARGIDQGSVLQAMRTVPRHLFVPEELQAAAYADHPLAIGQGQTISQPYVVALMTQLLELRGGEKILEIGTGSGYHAAVMSRIAGSIYSVEIIPELARRARRTLEQIGYDNVHVRHGDGYQGWPEEAPFDAIVLTAAPEQIPPPLLDQLKVGGRMVAPVGGFFQELKLIVKHDDGIETRSVEAVRFVPMTGKAQEPPR